MSASLGKQGRLGSHWKLQAPSTKLWCGFPPNPDQQQRTESWQSARRVADYKLYGPNGAFLLAWIWSGLTAFYLLNCESSNCWIVHFLSCWIVEVFELLHCWIVGILDWWIFGLLTWWIVELLIYRIVELLNCWIVELLNCLNWILGLYCWIV